MAHWFDERVNLDLVRFIVYVDDGVIFKFDDKQQLSVTFDDAEESARYKQKLVKALEEINANR